MGAFVGSKGMSVHGDFPSFFCLFIEDTKVAYDSCIVNENINFSEVIDGCFYDFLSLKN
jgi:hypothetical protein